ncbi:hypothetical protein ACVIYL_003401 [Bradyrhizobium sp. USDA 3315]
MRATIGSGGHILRAIRHARREGRFAIVTDAV